MAAKGLSLEAEVEALITAIPSAGSESPQHQGKKGNYSKVLGKEGKWAMHS